MHLQLIRRWFFLWIAFIYRSRLLNLDNSPTCSQVYSGCISSDGQAEDDYVTLYSYVR